MFNLIKIVRFNMQTASVAQWLEHWSCKPGVESSILSRGSEIFFIQHHLVQFQIIKIVRFNMEIAFVAQWLEHWFRKAGVKSSILSRGWPVFFYSKSFISCLT